MTRETIIAGEVTETLIAAQTIVRRRPTGGGEIDFVGAYVITHGGTAILAIRESGRVRATFDELSGVDFPVTMPNGSVVQVKGSTILAALDSVYDYVRALRYPAAPEPPAP